MGMGTDFQKWDCLTSQDSLTLLAPDIESLKSYIKSVIINPPYSIKLGLISSEFRYNLQDYLEERKMVKSVETIIDTSQVFLAPELTVINLQLLKTIEGMVENERPQTLIRMSDNKQVAINQKFLDILAAPPELACGRNVKMGWNPPDLEECQRLMRQQSRFELKYGSGFNPNLYAVSKGEIQVLEIAGETYRLNTNIDWNAAEWPECMLQLQQFEW